MVVCVVVLALVAFGGQVSGELLSHISHLQPPQDIFTNFDNQGSYDNQIFLGQCREDEARGSDGRCVKASITKSFYVFNAPPAPKIPVGPPPYLPDPKVHYNFVFIRSSQAIGSSKPIVVPPPQQKTLVYVLSKRPGVSDREVIEVPSQPVAPEVFFVNYAPGDDTQLPGGVSLKEALGRSATQGKVIDTTTLGQYTSDLISRVDGPDLEYEFQGLQQIQGESVGLSSESALLKHVRPVPHHVPYGPENEAIRAPAPIEILPPAPFYPVLREGKN